MVAAAVPAPTIGNSAVVPSTRREPATQSRNGAAMKRFTMANVPVCWASESRARTEVARAQTLGLDVKPTPGPSGVKALTAVVAPQFHGKPSRRALARSGIASVNPVELHPYFTQPGVQAANAEQNVLTQAWSPLVASRATAERLRHIQGSGIGGMADERGATTAEITLRWHLHEGRSAIPKSVSPERIAFHLDVFDFELTPDQIAAVDNLNTGDVVVPNRSRYSGTSE